MLVSTGSNGSPGASGLIAGFSSNIYKRGQENPADKDQSGNNDSNQGTASEKNSELIRRLEREVEDAERARVAACKPYYDYKVLGFDQQILESDGKAISGEKHNPKTEQELKEKCDHASQVKRDAIQQLEKAIASTPKQGQQSPANNPTASTSKQDRKHSVAKYHSDNNGSDQGTTSSKNSELIHRLEIEFQDAEEAESISRNSYYEYRDLGFEQERLIAQGKAISGEKHSKQRQDQMDREWEVRRKRLDFLRQKLREARLGTPSRDRKHSVAKDHSDNNGSDQGTTSGKNNELIHQLKIQVEDAGKAESIARNSYYEYRDLGFEQKREWEATKRRLDILRQKLQEAMLGTPSRDRKHSIDKPGPSTPNRDRKHSIDEPGPSTPNRDRKHSIDKPDPSTSGRDRKHSIVRHHSDTDSDQGIAPAKKHRPTHQLDINLENAERARAAACNSYYEYKATRLEQKKLKSNGQKISGKKYSSRTEHELKETCRKASKAKHYMIRQLEGTNGNTPSRSRKHSVVRHHSDTDSDQETLSRKKYRKLVRKLKRKIKEYKRRRKGACKKYRKHQFFVSKQWSRLAKGKSVSKSFYSLKGEEKWKRRCERQGRRVEYLEQKLRELMDEPDSDSD
ncbi:hypothetical protein BDEG_23210 [Batrachochytrium dendrobatidis JEL423]|uniref:Uncharacterized protein n=1 Tax=Batrachochytrium dendrobatidis (strain JEL423) TaxID=403673 RepID=A0A177WGX6_BATDL|nr:hypothetical protein BDEG_23210 [Batrachochytrium dendrobatidis JEL423]